jgi:uncharacterized protein YkwD
MKIARLLRFCAIVPLIFGITAPAVSAQGDHKGRLSYSFANTSDSFEFSRPRIISPVGAAPARASLGTAGKRLSASAILGMEKTALEMINRKRAEAGLQNLVWSDDVARIAKIHSENMVAYNFFSHAGTDGSLVDRRADSLGVRRWRAIGENIAFNRGYDDPVACAVEKWMLSAAHRANLLSPRWRETGIGISVMENGTFYFTQVFLVRR